MIAFVNFFLRNKTKQFAQFIQRIYQLVFTSNFSWQRVAFKGDVQRLFYQID